VESEYQINLKGSEAEIMESLAQCLRLSELTKFSDFNVYNNFMWEDVPQWMKDNCRWQAEFILRILKEQFGKR